MPTKPKEKKKEELSDEIKQIRKSNKQNLVCADCPNRAPPYVCTNFATFVCTDCSGVHRKFGHRVKSIAAATFAQNEVEKLKQGGNEVANAHYLARYKNGKDTFVLPREGERDRIEQYLTLKYVEKKWYKEKLISKEKKVKKAKDKKEENDSGTEEVAALVPVVSSPQRSIVSSAPSTSRQLSLPQPEEDLLSPGPNPQKLIIEPIDDQVALTNKSNESKDSLSNQNWDPWSNDNTKNNSVNDNTTVQDGWGADLWEDTNATTNTTTINNTNSTIGMTMKPNSQNLTNLYQSSYPSILNSGFPNPSPMGTGVVGMTMPMNSSYPMTVNMSGATMPVWGAPLMVNNSVSGFVSPTQLSSQTPQPSSFLGALNQVNQKKEDDEKKRKEPVLQQSNVSEKEESDPFASLIGSIDLNLNENPTSNATTTPMTYNNKTNQGYNLNVTPNVGLAAYGNNSQTFPTNASYYGAPTMGVGVTGNPMIQTTVPMNAYMTGGPVPNASMHTMPGVQYLGNSHTNVPMYGHFVPNIVSNQRQPNIWHNPNFGTLGSTSKDADNPFR